MKKKAKKKKKAGLYIVGSLALAAGAVIVAPRIINYLSDKMYTPTPSATEEDDDWGPEIVKRDQTNNAGAVEKGATDGEL